LVACRLHACRIIILLAILFHDSTFRVDIAVKLTRIDARTFKQIIAGATLVVILSGWVRAEKFTPEEQLLRSRGLVKVEQKKCWVVPLEIELRQRVRAISNQHAQLVQTQTATTRLAQTVAIANEQVRLALADTQRSLKLREAQRAQRNGLAEEKLLDELIKRDQAQLSALEKRWIEPSQEERRHCEWPWWS
jgi:hypothetical protein